MSPIVVALVNASIGRITNKYVSAKKNKIELNKPTLKVLQRGKCFTGNIADRPVDGYYKRPDGVAEDKKF
eukprot:7261573-Ditylum_brightwellii.AAC.1